MNKQLKNVPEGNKGLKKLDKDVRNKMGFMAKGGMAAKGMAKGGAIKMAKGGMAAKGMAKGGAVKMREGGKVEAMLLKKKKKYELPKDFPVQDKSKPTGKETKKMAKGGAVKMAGGGMAKGYKIGGKVATKGGTKGGATGGKKVAKKRDGIAKRGKTRA